MLNLTGLYSFGAEAPGQQVPLPNVSGKILAKVIEYCSFHINNKKDSKAPNSQASKTEDEIKSWDLDFMKVDQSTLFEIILVSLGFITFSLKSIPASVFDRRLPEICLLAKT